MFLYALSNVHDKGYLLHYLDDAVPKAEITGGAALMGGCVPTSTTSKSLGSCVLRAGGALAVLEGACAPFDGKATLNQCGVRREGGVDGEDAVGPACGGVGQTLANGKAFRKVIVDAVAPDFTI